MTLQNLAKIGQLKPHKATAEEVARLLAAVRRNLADAEVKGISNETRFDCGYKAVMQCALICRSAGNSRSGESTTVSLAVPPTRAPPAAAAVTIRGTRKARGAEPTGFMRAIRRF